MAMELTLEQWIEKYKPYKYDEDYDFDELVEKNQVWSIIDGCDNDEDVMIVAGLHFVNFLNGIATRVPYEDEYHSDWAIIKNWHENEKINEYV